MISCRLCPERFWGLKEDFVFSLSPNVNRGFVFPPDLPSFFNMVLDIPTKSSTISSVPTKPTKPIERVCSDKIKKTNHCHGIKEPYIRKWIRQNRIKKFNLDDYLRRFPLQGKKYVPLSKYLSELIGEGVLRQWDDRNFDVLRVPLPRSSKKELK